MKRVIAIFAAFLMLLPTAALATMHPYEKAFTEQRVDCRMGDLRVVDAYRTFAPDIRELIIVWEHIPSKTQFIMLQRPASLLIFYVVKSGNAEKIGGYKVFLSEARKYFGNLDEKLELVGRSCSRPQK